MKEAEFKNYRKMIELFDRDLIQTLAQRFETVQLIAEVKRKAGSPIADPDRERELCEKHAEWAKEFGVDKALVAHLFKFIIEEAKRLQR